MYSVCNCRLYAVGCRVQFVRVLVPVDATTDPGTKLAVFWLVVDPACWSELTGWLITRRMKQIEDFWKLRGNSRQAGSQKDLDLSSNWGRRQQRRWWQAVEQMGGPGHAGAGKCDVLEFSCVNGALASEDGA